MLQTRNTRQYSMADYELPIRQLFELEVLLRGKYNNAKEFQENMGHQGYLLSKMGRYKEALKKYETQAEVCAEIS